MKLRLFIFLIALSPAVRAVNDFWIGCHYSVSLSFSSAELGKKNAPKPKSIRLPEFPAGMMNGELEDSVTVDFIVAPDGSPSDVRIVKESNGAYRDAVMSTVRSWRFFPGVDFTTHEPTSIKMRCEVRFAGVEKGAAN